MPDFVCLNTAEVTALRAWWTAEFYEPVALSTALNKLGIYDSILEPEKDGEHPPVPPEKQALDPGTRWDGVILL